jgi:ketosteroid isomerase-like protein
MRVVRVKMTPRPRRTALERLLTLAPETYRPLMVPVFRLPAGSRLRTATLKAVMERGYAALNRGDLEFLKRLLYLPDMTLRFVGDIGPDFGGRYEGRDACFDAYERWLTEWGSVRREAVGFVDRGEVLVVLVREVMRGEGSGLEVEREVGQWFRLRGAGIAEQVEYRSWDEALAA